MPRHFLEIGWFHVDPNGPQRILGMMPTNGVAGDHGHEVRG